MQLKVHKYLLMCFILYGYLKILRSILLKNHNIPVLCLCDNMNSKNGILPKIRIWLKLFTDI